MGDCLATVDIGQKLRRGCAPLGVSWAEAYLRTKWHLDPSSHLATTDKPKIGGLSPPFLNVGELGPRLAQCGPGPRPTSIPSGILIHAAIWPQYTWAENWGFVPSWELGSHLKQCGQS